MRYIKLYEKTKSPPEYNIGDYVLATTADIVYSQASLFGEFIGMITGVHNIYSNDSFSHYEYSIEHFRTIPNYQWKHIYIAEDSIIRKLESYEVDAFHYNL